MRFAPLNLLCLFIALFSTDCAVTPATVEGAASRVKVEQWTKLAAQATLASKKPRAFLLPELLVSNRSEAGSTEWRAGPEGRYQVTFWTFPGVGADQVHQVMIVASPLPAPDLDEAPSHFFPAPSGGMVERSVAWQEVEVPALKRKLRYYLEASAFGDSHTTWASEVFTLSTPDGRQGSYQVTVECDDPERAKAQFSKLQHP